MVGVQGVSAAGGVASRRGEGMGTRVRARVTPRTRAAVSTRVVAKDYPKPEQIDKTENYRIAQDLSNKIKVRDCESVLLLLLSERTVDPRS